MPFEAFLWLFLPLFVAGGSALLSFYIMQARMEVAVSKEREHLAEARATITSQKVTLEERIRATEESTKRAALDEFMQDFRIEERSYARESKSMSANRKSMIMQERLYFRNIPLSNWIEREMVIEEGRDLDQARESVFTPNRLAGPQPSNVTSIRSKQPLPLPEDVVVALPAPQDQNAPRSLVSVYLTAFGAQ